MVVKLLLKPFSSVIGRYRHRLGKSLPYSTDRQIG